MNNFIFFSIRHTVIIVGPNVKKNEVIKYAEMEASAVQISIINLCAM